MFPDDDQDLTGGPGPRTAPARPGARGPFLEARPLAPADGTRSPALPVAQGGRKLLAKSLRQIKKTEAARALEPPPGRPRDGRAITLDLDAGHCLSLSAEYWAAYEKQNPATRPERRIPWVGEIEEPDPGGSSGGTGSLETGSRELKSLATKHAETNLLETIHNAGHVGKNADMNPLETNASRPPGFGSDDRVGDYSDARADARGNFVGTGVAVHPSPPALDGRGSPGVPLSARDERGAAAVFPSSVDERGAASVFPGGLPADMEDPDFEFEFARNSPDWTIQELLDLMAWGREQGMSDLILTSSDRPWMRLDGVWRGLGRRRVQLGELAALLNRLTRNEAAGAMVGTGLELDFGCELPKGRGRRIRFRGNASAVANGWSTGVTMTLRSLPDFPPPLETLEIEPELLAGLFPENGLVLVTGVMGSGKSTLLASVLRRLAEGGRRHIATYEAPIEFDLGGLPGRLSPVEQSEVPRHCEGFTAAARNVTRRAADVVLMGESRDCETIRGLMEAAEIGVAAYTTVHTRSVADTPGRIISLFSARERPAMAASLLSALRVVVQQRLYPSPDGGRRAVREFLALSPDMRAMLQKERPARLAPALDEMVESSGQTLEAAVGREVGLGRLSPEVLELVRSERRGRRDRHER